MQNINTEFVYNAGHAVAKIAMAGYNIYKFNKTRKIAPLFSAGILTYQAGVHIREILVMSQRQSDQFNRALFVDSSRMPTVAEAYSQYQDCVVRTIPTPASIHRASIDLIVSDSLCLKMTGASFDSQHAIALCEDLETRQAFIVMNERTAKHQYVEWFIQHELGHYSLGHHNGPVEKIGSHEYEAEADLYAEQQTGIPARKVLGLLVRESFLSLSSTPAQSKIMRERFLAAKRPVIK